MGGRDQMESLAGMKWNQWPRSNGMGGRDRLESVAGIIWNLHLSQFVKLYHKCPVKNQIISVG